MDRESAIVKKTMNHFKCQLLICEDLRAGSVFWLHSCGALQRSTAEKLRQIFKKAARRHAAAAKQTIRSDKPPTVGLKLRLSKL